MKIFISYAREDRSIAMRFFSMARKRGHEPWLDNQSLPVGAQWEKLIDNAIRNADLVVVLITKRLLRRPESYVARELEIAGQYWPTRLKHQAWIIPVTFGGATIPDWPITDNVSLKACNGISIGWAHPLGTFFSKVSTQTLQHDIIFARMVGTQWQGLWMADLPSESDQRRCALYIGKDWAVDMSIANKGTGSQLLAGATGHVLLNPERSLLVWTQSRPTMVPWMLTDFRRDRIKASFIDPLTADERTVDFEWWGDDEAFENAVPTSIRYWLSPSDFE